MGEMGSTSPAPSMGQISADGQFRWDGAQWVPLAAGHREPTGWTRPMQLLSAAIFLVSAVANVAFTIIFVNRDAMLNAIKAQGTQVPSGSDIDTVVNVAIGVTYGIVIFISLLSVVAAIGSYLGWRWMFWVALVLFGLSGIGTFTNLGMLFNPSTSPLPLLALGVNELFSVLSLAVCIWMIIAAVRYGPWAMKKPGS
jgi:hypothetical protein